MRKNLETENKLKKLVVFLMVLVAILTSIILFLGNEMVKKFEYFNSFAKSSNQLLDYTHGGLETPRMRNIVLRSKDGQPFTALVGFYLEVPGIGAGFDYYGYVESNSKGVAVISTFIGKNLVAFQFFVDCDLRQNPITITSKEVDQILKPDVTYPPHWWQRLGFYS